MLQIENHIPDTCSEVSGTFASPLVTQVPSPRSHIGLFNMRDKSAFVLAISCSWGLAQDNWSLGSPDICILLLWIESVWVGRRAVSFHPQTFFFFFPLPPKYLFFIWTKDEVHLDMCSKRAGESGSLSLQLIILTEASKFRCRLIPGLILRIGNVPIAYAENRVLDRLIYFWLIWKKSLLSSYLSLNLSALLAKSLCESFLLVCFQRKSLFLALNNSKILTREYHFVTLPTVLLSGDGMINRVGVLDLWKLFRILHKAVSSSLVKKRITLD